MVTALAFIFVFGLLTIFHEVGHFLAAKLAGIRVEEFGIGFGPKIMSIQRGETLYSLRLLPLGGFVKMTGEDGSVPDDQRSFANKPVLSRLTVIGAGPLMNFVLAVLLFSLIFFLVGVPERDAVIGGVVAESPAREAGLQPGDRVVAVNETRVGTWDEMVTQIQQAGTGTITLDIQRRGEGISLTVVPSLHPESGKPFIGVERPIHRYRFFKAWHYGFLQTIGLVTFMGRWVVEVLSGQVAPEVAGPVGIVQVVGEVARTGVLNLLSLAAILSINLALFNLFPIPMLDGGQLLFLGIEALRGKPLDPEQEGFYRFIGILLLLLLLVTVTYRDIMRLIV